MQLTVGVQVLKLDEKGLEALKKLLKLYQPSHMVRAALECRLSRLVAGGVTHASRQLCYLATVQAPKAWDSQIALHVCHGQLLAPGQPPLMSECSGY